MAPKYHPTPLSGGDRKALTKELGKSRAMANILAAQSVAVGTRIFSSPPAQIPACAANAPGSSLGSDVVR